MNLNGPAAARLYDEHVDAIYTYVARRLGTGPAIEVVGEVFQHALRAERNDTSGTERGWLLAIATALLRRHAELERSRLLNWESVTGVRASAVGSSDPLMASRANQDATTNTTAVMSAVADLDPVDRDLLLLSAWERCPNSMLAEAVGIQTREVRSRLNRVRKDLKRLVANDASRVVGDVE